MRKKDQKLHLPPTKLVSLSLCVDYVSLVLSFLIYTEAPLSFFHNSQNYSLRNCFLIFNILLGFYREEDDGVKRENEGCVRNL